jgi:hypothetical protein
VVLFSFDLMERTFLTGHQGSVPASRAGFLLKVYECWNRFKTTRQYEQYSLVLFSAVEGKGSGGQPVAADICRLISRNALAAR